MNPAIEHVLKFFKYDHLPQRLQLVSKPFADLAHFIVQTSPPEGGPEVTVSLRKLLESKDAAVRACL